MYFDFQDNVKPSIGTNGKFCVCVKPNESFDADTTASIGNKELAAYKGAHSENEEEDDVETDTSSIADVYELYQSDFEAGTYRITKKGTYKIMEDIEFDFNSGDLDDPNTDGWWPTSEQSLVW